MEKQDEKLPLGLKPYVLLTLGNFYGRCPAGRGRHNVKISVCLCICVSVSVVTSIFV